MKWPKKQFLEVFSVTMAKTLTFENALYLIKENRTVEDAILTLQNQVIETKTVKISYIITATQARTPESFTMTVQHQIVRFYNSKGEFFYWQLRTGSIIQSKYSGASASNNMKIIYKKHSERTIIGNITVLQTSLRKNYPRSRTFIN